MTGAFLSNNITIYYMKAISVPGVSSKNGFIFTCGVIISIGIATALNASYNYMTPSDVSNTSFLMFTLMVASMICMSIWSVNLGDRKYILVFLATIIVSGISCHVIIAAYESVTYYDDCSTLNDMFDINRFNCIDYAINNPDATGAEIVEALTIKVQPIDFETSILDRPLNP